MLTKSELEEIRARHEAYTPSLRDVPNLLDCIAAQEAKIKQLWRALKKAHQRNDMLKGVDSTAPTFGGR